MKNMSSVFLLSTLMTVFSNSLSAEENTDFNCIATKSNDICIKIEKSQDVKPLDAYKNGYWDALLSYSGQALWDGLTGEAKNIGKELAVQAVGVIASSYGVPPAVLGMIGFGGGATDISNREVVAQIDAIIQAQTKTLLEAMEDSNAYLVDNFDTLLTDAFQNNCMNMSRDVYNAQIEDLYRWNGYDISLKDEIDQRTNMLAALNTLAELRHRYADNLEDYCFYGRHVEYFSWAIGLYSLDLNMRVEYQNVVSQTESARLFNSRNDMTRLKEAMDDNLSNLEVSHANYKTGDETIDYWNDLVAWDKANAFWDDVLLSSSAPKLLPRDTNCKTTTIPTNSEAYRRLYAERDNLILVKSVHGVDSIEQCDHTEYTVDGTPYNFKEIRMNFVATCEGGGDRGFFYNCITRASILLAAHINNNHRISMYDNVFLMTPADQWISYYSNKPFLKKIYQYHRDLDYSQKLQMAYLPYTGFIDKLWENLEETRPSNKLDRELQRTSGLFNLDDDGLSIELEMELGTNPRKIDSDNDSFDDGFEYRNRHLGYDPAKFNTPANTVKFSKPTRRDEYSAANRNYIWVSNTNGNQFCREEGFSSMLSYEIGCGADEDSFSKYASSRGWYRKNSGSKDRCYDIYESISCAP